MGVVGWCLGAYSAVEHICSPSSCATSEKIFSMAAASASRTLRKRHNLSYAGLDEGSTIIINDDDDDDVAPAREKKKRGRPPGSGSKAAHESPASVQPKKRGRPLTRVALPLRPLEPPACGEVQLAQWREQLASLPDDSMLSSTQADDGSLPMASTAAPIAPAPPGVLRSPPEARGHLLQVRTSISCCI